VLYTITAILLILGLLVAHALDARIPALAQAAKDRQRNGAPPPRIRHSLRRSACFPDASHRRLQHRRRLSPAPSNE